MKCILLSVAMIMLMIASQAQKTTLVQISEDADKTEVSLFNDKLHVTDNYFGDTTYVRIGKHNLEIIEDGNRTHIDLHKDRDWDDDSDWRRKHKRFNGHWAGLEMGFNSFYDTDYSLYPNDGDFMELDQPKSLEVTLNFLEYNIALQNHRSNIGLVTGMGFSMNNYRFDNYLTVNKEDDIIVPVPVDSDNFKKSKLVVSYLTVPLLLEFQIPINKHSNHLYLSGGVIGGINIGSHTKIKQDHSKTKDRGSFKINPFKYAATARVGLKDISVYAVYNLSPLFKEDKGPELFPFSVGICLVNL